LLASFYSFGPGLGKRGRGSVFGGSTGCHASRSQGAHSIKAANYPAFNPPGFRTGLPYPANEYPWARGSGCSLSEMTFFDAASRSIEHDLSENRYPLVRIML
jgi:hypothetical protein